MSATTLVLATTVRNDENNTPVDQTAKIAVWDDAGSTGYTWDVGGIALGADVAATVQASAADYLAAAIAAGNRELPHPLSQRASLFAQLAPVTFYSGAVAGTIKASSKFGQITAGQQNVVNGVLNNVAATEWTFMTIPGFTLG